MQQCQSSPVKVGKESAVEEGWVVTPMIHHCSEVERGVAHLVGFSKTDPNETEGMS